MTQLAKRSFIAADLYTIDSLPLCSPIPKGRPVSSFRKLIIIVGLPTLQMSENIRNDPKSLKSVICFELQIKTTYFIQIFWPKLGTTQYTHIIVRKVPISLHRDESQGPLSTFK